MGTAKKLTGPHGETHRHGSVDSSVYDLAKMFVVDAGAGCASCLAFEIQTAIEDFLEDAEELKGSSDEQ